METSLPGWDRGILVSMPMRRSWRLGVSRACIIGRQTYCGKPCELLKLTLGWLDLIYFPEFWVELLFQEILIETCYTLSPWPMGNLLIFVSFTH